MDNDSSRGAIALTGLIAGQYRIERELGAGGMGAVYLARDTRLKRRVAIKTVLASHATSTQVRRRFERETRLATQISHPYVATVFDVVEHDGHRLLVMEYLTGRPLNEVLRDERPPLRRRMRWVVEIAEALNAIHLAGIVHRDVKPGNVMVTDNGHVKVTDFGLARTDLIPLPDATTMTGEASLTQTGAVLGTLTYMSPEQLRGRPADARSDRFSFGILAWEVLIGTHPFVRSTPAESVSAILNDEPSLPADTPAEDTFAERQTVLLRLLRKEPAERFATTSEMVDALRAAAGTGGESIAPAASRAAWLKPVGAIVVALLLLSAAGMWWLRQPPTWEGERFVVAVAPLQYAADDPDAAVEAGIVADLLTRDLQASFLIRAEGPEQMRLAGLSPLPSLNELGVKISAARDTDYVLLGTLKREGARWAVTAQIKPAREGRGELPPLDVSGDSALALAEGLAAGVRRRLPDVSRLTAIRDDRVDLARLMTSSNEALEAYERGALAMREDRVVDAIAAFEAAIAADATFTLAQARLAEALLEAGYGRRARAAADRARDLAPRKATRLEDLRLQLTAQAIRSRAFGDTQQWVVATDELLRRFPNEPALMLEHARALSADEQSEEALLLLEQALQLDSRNPSLREAQVRVLAELGRYEEATQTLRSLRALFEFLGSEEGLAAVERMQGSIAEAQEDFDSALAHFNESAERYARVGREVTAAYARLDAQGARLARSDLAGAEAAIESAFETGREAGNLKLQAEALNSRAVLELSKQAWDEGIASFEQSADIARQLGNAHLLAQALGNASGYLVWLGRLDDAAPVLDELALVAAEIDDRDIVVATLTTRADLATQMGDLDAAESNYEGLFAMRGDRPEGRFLSATMASAALYRQRGLLGRALNRLDEAVDGARVLERPLDLGRALQNRARVHSALGDVAAADSDMAELLPIAEQYTDLQSATRLMRVVMKLHRGDWEAVIATGPELSERYGATILLWRCAAQFQLGDARSALETCGDRELAERGGFAERAEARGWKALALVDLGRYEEAIAESELARAEAQRMGLLLVEARAAAVLAVVPAAHRPGDWDAIVRAGSAALDAAITDAPADDRASFESRPDLQTLRNWLNRSE